MGDGGDALRVVDQPVEERLVELGVDEPGPLRLELVRQPARAEDRDALGAWVRLDRAADRLTEREAASAGGWRVLHDVDRQRDDWARPLVDLAEHDRERHGEAVVDLHRVDERHVELIEDQRLRQVPRQVGVAGDGWHRPRSEALVGDAEHGGHAEREGGDDLQRERAGVVVVDDDARVGVELGDPLTCRSELRDVRRPVGLAGQPLVERGPDRRDVRGADATHDLSHRCGPLRCPGRLASGCPRWVGRRRASSLRTPRGPCRSGWRRAAGRSCRRRLRA